MSNNVANLLYLVTIICFVLALRFLSSPTTARLGNWIGAAGMTVIPANPDQATPRTPFANPHPTATSAS